MINKFVPNNVPSQCFSFINSKNPTIIQIGSNDGVVGEEYGFHEFLDELENYNLHLIEPIVTYFDKLPLVYDKKINDTKIIHYHNFAITETENSVFMCDDGGCSSISIDGNIKVNTQTWSNFIVKNTIINIDLLLIDCEGYEFKILSDIFSKGNIYPKVIRYEYVHLENKEETDILLIDNGYTILFCDTDPVFNKVAIRK